MTYTPEMILERWIEYVNRSEVDNIVRLYDTEGTLLPTFSPHYLTTPLQIKGYFEQLSTRKNMSVKMHGETVKKQEIGGGKHVLMGTYSFSFEVDAVNLTFPSRFTFVVDESRESPILHHHSSEIPRTIS